MRPSWAGRPPLLRLLGLVLVVAVAAGSCGSDDDGSGALTLDDVYAEVDGLDREARQGRLLELAAAEDATLQLYTIVNLDDSAVYTEAFTDATGIDVELFRGRGGELLQRVLEEDSAGRVGFDVLMVSAPEMVIIDAEGIMADLTTPYTDDIVATAVNPTWAGVYLNVFLAAWNTDIVDAAERPTTWEEVLTDHADAVALEAGDFDWFATLVQDYFVGRLGYTEDDAVDLFRQAADAGRIIDGHTTLAELLGAGEFDVVTSAYHHGIERYKNDGAPIDWQPAVEPLVMRPTGIGVRADAEHPASALLFVDFMLSEPGQTALTSVFRTPSNQNVDGGISPDVDVLNIDIEALNATREKWERLYEEIIRGS